MRTTIVLVHGAFAESASWDGVIEPLVAEGHRVVAAANPLRGLAADAAAVSDLVRTIEGPVVLVAHSYGGAVISNVDRRRRRDRRARLRQRLRPGARRELLRARGACSRAACSARKRCGRSRAATERPTSTSLAESFHDMFCPDVPAPQAARMAATQRPVTQEALVEPSGERPLWKDVPSWFVIGEEDRNIPAALQHYMAERAARAAHDRDPGRVARHPRRAPRRDRAPDPRGRRAARGRLRWSDAPPCGSARARALGPMGPIADAYPPSDPLALDPLSRRLGARSIGAGESDSEDTSER